MPLQERTRSAETTTAVRSQLEGADAATLLLVLVQLTGEREWLERARPFIQGPMSYQERMPDELRAAIRDRLAEVLADQPPPRPPDDDLLVEMMSVAAGEPVASEYIPMMREDLLSDTLQSRSLQWRTPPSATQREACDVLVIGAGMSGLAAAIQLQAAGLPFRVIEKNTEVGGTWYENRYPGCGVDTPNHFYSYAFAPNHDWTRLFAKRDELRAYFDRIADQFPLRDRITFGAEAECADWEEDAARWRVVVRHRDGRRETLSARVLISAVGILNRPKLPEIPGRDSFAGSQFHTAEWDEGFDWSSKRVAMIGTGASGHQVGPAIAPDVAADSFPALAALGGAEPELFSGRHAGQKMGLGKHPSLSALVSLPIVLGFCRRPARRSEGRSPMADAGALTQRGERTPPAVHGKAHAPGARGAA